MLSTLEAAKKQNEFLAKYAVTGDVGPAVAETIITFFQAEAGQHVIARLAELGIDPVSDNHLPIAAEADLSHLPLAGKTFVITGTLSLDRDAMKELIEAKGGKVSGSVSAKTHYVLAGEGGGSFTTSRCGANCSSPLPPPKRGISPLIAAKLPRSRSDRWVTILPSSSRWAICPPWPPHSNPPPARMTTADAG